MVNHARRKSFCLHVPICEGLALQHVHLKLLCAGLHPNHLLSYDRCANCMFFYILQFICWQNIFDSRTMPVLCFPCPSFTNLDYRGAMLCSIVIPARVFFLGLQGWPTARDSGWWQLAGETKSTSVENWKGLQGWPTARVSGWWQLAGETKSTSVENWN